MQFLSTLLALPAASYAYYSNASATAAPAPVSPSSSQDVTTYVTVELGKTLTLTSQKPKATTPAAPAVEGVASSSADLTTYVTVELGKTMTITTQAAPTGEAPVLANGAQKAAGVAAGVAGIAGAAALLL